MVVTHLQIDTGAADQATGQPCRDESDEDGVDFLDIHPGLHRVGQQRQQQPGAEHHRPAEPDQKPVHPRSIGAPTVSKTPVSPKVTSGGVWAGYATLILALLSTVTPDSLAFMGHLAPLGYGVVIGGSYALGAFLKTDPLRVAVKPGLQNDAAGLLQQSLDVLNRKALSAQGSAPTSFAATQARLDAAAAPEVPAAPVTVTPVYEPPAPPASV